MNKNRIKAVIIFVAMVVSMFGSINAYATTCTLTQSGDAEVTATITPDTDRVSVGVFPLGKRYDDLLATNEENYNHIMVYVNEFEATSGVAFPVIMDFSDLSSGTYVVSVSEDGVVTKKRIDFKNKERIRDAYAIINDTTSTLSEIEDAIDTYYLEIGIAEEDYTDADISVVASYLKNEVADGAVLVEDSAASEKLIAQAVTVGLLKADNLEDIYGRISSFDIADTDLNGWYDNAFVTETMKAEITTRMAASDVSDYDKFIDAFEDAYILSVVSNTDQASTVKSVVVEFIPEGADITERKCGQLMGYYSDMETLVAKVKELCAGGGGGGGGGGGATGNGIIKDKVTETLPGNVATEPAGKLDVDIFSDLGSVSWAKDSIVALAEKGVISGKGGDEFCPNDMVTRYEFAKIAVLAFLPNAEAAATNFADIPADHWAYEYVQKAYGAGLIKGRTDYKFDGNGKITREEMATILLRAAQAAGVAVSSYEDAKGFVFRDDASISDFAREAIYILKYDSIINGVGDDNFAPAKNATRAEAAHMVYTLTQF